MISFRIQGFQEALKDLEKLQGKDRERVFKKALRAAGKVLRLQLAMLTPIRSGTMKRSMQYRVKYNKKTDTFILLVGVKSWYSGIWQGKKVVPHRYGHFVTGGRKGFQQNIRIRPGQTLKVGRNGFIKNHGKMPMFLTRKVGAAKPNDLLFTAFKLAEGRAMEVVRNAIIKGLNELR